MLNLYLYGCGGHGRVILDILQRQERIVTAWIDANPPPNMSQICGIPTYTADEALSTLCPEKSEWIISIGNNQIRQKIAQQLQEMGHCFTTAIHPSAQIGFGVEIGSGTVVMANTVISCNTKIGKHAIINTGAVVDHDCIVGDYCHLSPSTTLCGHVKLGNHVFLGVGTQVAPCLEIADRMSCVPGTVVVQSIET